MGNNFEFSGGVVGIDLSLTGTGFARLSENGSLDVVESFGTKAGFDILPERWRYIVKCLSFHIEPNDLVFIEDYAYGKATGFSKGGQKSDSSVITLSELGGIVKLFIYGRTNRMPIPVASTTIKAFFGSGKMKKDMMPTHIYKKLRVDCNTHDEYVALGLAALGWCASGRTPMRGETLAYEAKACKKVIEKVQALPQLYLGKDFENSKQFYSPGVNA